MLIGEAPGREEDLIGKPFVGRAGKLLNQLLAQSRIKREKIFITSVIKHRPPNNRTPKREEIEACKIWWQKQVDIINPSLIILLGRVASDTVIGKEEFKKARGNFLTKNNRRYFVTYHPAAGLRFPKIKKILERDFRKLKKMSL